MARKRAGDLLNILSDPENREGLVTGKSPVQMAPTQAPPSKFPGIVGLGAVTGTGVPPMQRRALLDDDEDKGPRGFRMDLALAALLGLLVTNIVSFTLGARAGRQSVDPTLTTALAPSTPTTELGQQPEAPTPKAPATPWAPEPETPATAPATQTYESTPMPLSGNTTAPSTPATSPTTAPAPAPAPQTHTPSEPDMKGKYVVRLITLPYDERGKGIAEKICAYIESQGLGPAIARPVGGKLVVEAGRHTKYDDAQQAAGKLRKLRQGFNTFETAYVTRRQ